MAGHKFQYGRKKYFQHWSSVSGFRLAAIFVQSHLISDLTRVLKSHVILDPRGFTSAVTTCRAKELTEVCHQVVQFQVQFRVKVA